MKSEDLIPLLLIFGLVGVAVWLVVRNNTVPMTAPPPAPCGVPVSTGGGTGTVIPCSVFKTILPTTINTATKVSASLRDITSVGTTGPSGATDYGHNIVGVGSQEAFGIVADAMCNCYHNYNGQYDGIEACNFVKRVAPEIDTCVNGDCDCHPTFQGADGNQPNPTTKSEMICYGSHNNPTKRCTRLGYADWAAAQPPGQSNATLYLQKVGR